MPGPCVSIPTNVDPLYYALSLFNRKKTQEAADVCTALLDENPYDKAVWFLKCRALKRMAYADDLDLEESGAGEMLMDENNTANAPRPGTSLSHNRTTGPDQSVRPVTKSGRLSTGFARPGTNSRPTSQQSMAKRLDTAMKGGRSSRPSTSLGRQIRLLTASAAARNSDTFIDVDRLDMRKYALRPSIARALCDYLIYHDANPRKALELAAEATEKNQFKDWWWKARLGKCYYQLGLFRDAEKQFKSAIKHRPMVSTMLELAKVHLRLDQPNAALETYKKALETQPDDTRVLIAIARVYEMLGDDVKMAECYKKVLSVEPSSIEAMASLAANHFYSDQPEVALRYFRRLIQAGISSPELYNNAALCCFYASQYDMALGLFSRALREADDDQVSAEIWYNIGVVGVSVADLNMAYQAFRISVRLNPEHAEALNNLAVLQGRMGKEGNFEASMRASPDVYEPRYNLALMRWKSGKLSESYGACLESSSVFPTHDDTKALMERLHQTFLHL